VNKQIRQILILLIYRNNFAGSKEINEEDFYFLKEYFSKIICNNLFLSQKWI